MRDRRFPSAAFAIIKAACGAAEKAAPLFYTVITKPCAFFYNLALYCKHKGGTQRGTAPLLPASVRAGAGPAARRKIPRRDRKEKNKPFAEGKRLVFLRVCGKQMPCFFARLREIARMCSRAHRKMCKTITICLTGGVIRYYLQEFLRKRLFAAVSAKKRGDAKGRQKERGVWDTWRSST